MESLSSLFSTQTEIGRL
jgi:hypothetical protein